MIDRILGVTVMKRIFVVSFLTILGGLSTNTVMAQSQVSSEVEQILEETDTMMWGMCQMYDPENCQHLDPEYKQYSKNLVDRCLQGDSEACNTARQEIVEQEEPTFDY